MMPLSNPSKPIEVDYIQEPSSDSADNMKYGEDGVKYRYYLPQNYDSEKSYPIVMYLHGAGRRGGNNNDQLVNDQYIVNSLLSEKYINNPDTQCIIIAPQCPSNEKWVNIPAWDTGSYEHDLYSAGNSLEAADSVPPQNSPLRSQRFPLSAADIVPSAMAESAGDTPDAADD